MDMLRHHDVSDDCECVLNSKLLDRTLADIAVGGTCQKRLPFVTAEGDEVGIALGVLIALEPRWHGERVVEGDDCVCDMDLPRPTPRYASCRTGHPALGTNLFVRQHGTKSPTCPEEGICAAPAICRPVRAPQRGSVVIHVQRIDFVGAAVAQHENPI